MFVLRAPGYPPRVPAVAVILPFGEPREGFFDDTVLGLIAARARARGHEAHVARVYYDGADPARDDEVRRALRAWLDARAVELVVVERLFDPAPLEGRRVVQITRGDSVDPIDGVELVIGAAAGLTRRGTTRTPSPGGLVLAFERVLDALAEGADPRDVPGVAAPGEPARAPLAPAPLPTPFEPVVDHEIIALEAPPPARRKTVYGNLGCPYAADPLDNPAFRGVRLPAAPVARLGCAFCSMGGDYEKRPDPEVVSEIVRQATYFHAAVDGLEELLINDQHALRYLAALMSAARALPPTRWLFAARADAFVREADRVRAAIEAAAAAGHRLEVYLSGFESFSDAALARYNKGVTASDLVRAVEAMRALHREAPATFDYRRSRGHSLILFSPWTDAAEIQESARAIRAHGLTELFDELGRNRLRLYADLPITYAAERDCALRADWDDGDEGEGRRKGYNVERPWRFLHASGRRVFEASRLLAARLGTETEVAQLLAASALGDDLDPGALGADLDRLEQVLASLLARARPPGAPSRGAQARAAPARMTGDCNNGCASCAQRDAWLDDRDAAVLARVDAARATGRPVLLAGREPTLHPAFGALLKRARGDDARAVGVVSNGRRFAYPRFASACLRAGLSAVSLKIFAPDAATADAITRVEGAHAQALEGARALAGRCALELRAPLHHANLDRLAELARVAAELGVPQIRVEVALDAVGLDRLAHAADAIEALGAACARAAVALEASPLRAGTRAFDWMPVVSPGGPRPRSARPRS